MSTALYNRDILRLAASIPHLGRLEAPQASATRRSPVCGSIVTVDVVTDEAGRVAALGQEVKACALGQASASLMGAHAVGRTAAELATRRSCSWPKASGSGSMVRPAATTRKRRN